MRPRCAARTRSVGTPRTDESVVHDFIIARVILYKLILIWRISKNYSNGDPLLAVATKSSSAARSLELTKVLLRSRLVLGWVTPKEVLDAVNLGPFVFMRT